MAFEDKNLRGPTSLAHDVFDVMFQAIDMAGGFWQPMLKGAGRWQLEVAHLMSRQTRANVELGQALMGCQSPEHFNAAYQNYWHTLAGCYSDAGRNIATALVRAAPHAAVLELPLKPKRHHDNLELIDSEQEAPARKVA